MADSERTSVSNDRRVTEQVTSFDRLRGFHATHNEIQAEYRKELRDLQRKYRLRYEPLYTMRYQALCEDPIPKFWLTAILNHPMLRDMVEAVDKPVLEHLEDIRCDYKVTDGSEDFRLIFVFSENPYFGTPLELVKRYRMEESSDVTDSVLASIETTTIAWKLGKDTTKKQVTRKQKNKRTKQIRKLTETVAVPSFFNFFAKLEMPSEEDLEAMGEERAEELECTIESDYEAACVFRDKIVPQAVDWYSGDAVDSDMELQEESSEDKDDSDANTDESEEESEEEGKTKTKKKRGKREDPAACKQQ